MIYLFFLNQGTANENFYPITSPVDPIVGKICVLLGKDLHER